jgi:hypothetical protein
MHFLSLKPLLLAFLSAKAVRAWTLRRAALKGKFSVAAERLHDIIA